MALVVVHLLVDIDDDDKYWLETQLRQTVTALRADGDRIYSADMYAVADESNVRVNLAEEV